MARFRKWNLRAGFGVGSRAAPTPTTGQRSAVTLPLHLLIGTPDAGSDTARVTCAPAVWRAAFDADGSGDIDMTEFETYHHNTRFFSYQTEMPHL